MQPLLSKIPAVRRGEDIRAEDWNAMREALIALANGENITEGIGVRKRQTGGGIILNADPKRTTGDGTAAATDSLPFKVTKAAGGAEENDSIKVLAGYLANIVIVEANYETPDVPEGGTTPTYACIEVTVADDAVTGASIVILTPTEALDFDLPGNTVDAGVFRIPLAKLELQLQGTEEAPVTRIISIQQLWKSGNIFNLIVSDDMAFYW
jgi:hypothetical protein